ncbi:hypothetical protein KCP74_03330 [Salmonella enterica subsp. enterica]|nr:hypothetical protein KCP74_03330 [Salmonella enterica subsp. enterica]
MKSQQAGDRNINIKSPQRNGGRRAMGSIRLSYFRHLRETRMKMEHIQKTAITFYVMPQRLHTNRTSPTAVAIAMVDLRRPDGNLVYW